MKKQKTDIKKTSKTVGSHACVARIMEQINNISFRGFMINKRNVEVAWEKVKIKHIPLQQKFNMPLTKAYAVSDTDFERIQKDLGIMNNNSFLTTDRETYTPLIMIRASLYERDRKLFYERLEQEVEKLLMAKIKEFAVAKKKRKEQIISASPKSV